MSIDLDALRQEQSALLSQKDAYQFQREQTEQALAALETRIRANANKIEAFQDGVQQGHAAGKAEGDAAGFERGKAEGYAEGHAAATAPPAAE